MSVSKQSSSYQADIRFISHSCASEDYFVKEYKKFYYERPHSKDLYIVVLTELKNATIAGNLGHFKRYVKVLGYINGTENRETAKNFFNDVENPFKTTNPVILACQNAKLDILKYVFGNSKVLENVSANVGKEPVTPYDQDESNHDAFHYAVLSGNVELLDMLIEKWPGDYFNFHSEELDEVLSKTYEKLKLKNVSLSENMEVYVENKLINLRFFSNHSGRVQISVGDQINNIKERVDLVLEKIEFLKSEYSNVEKLDEKFLFVARFIAQNIHVLKRQLRSTYDRLPWEEIEFCLISFISSYLMQKDINIFFRTILNKSKIISHLENFAKKLEVEKHIIDSADIGRLAELPKLNRDLVVEGIVRRNPEFQELYNDYQQIRDVHSLEKISEYLNLALSADPEERKGQLIITRALQVIGEYLKNTLESPKLSNTTSELLLVSLPKNTRKIIIDLRNSLSHASSLSKRAEIEDNTDVDFFIGVQRDTKRIENVITEILYKNKMIMIRTLLIRVADSKTRDELKEVSVVLKDVELDNMKAADFKMSEHETLEKLIREMSDAVTEKTEEEIDLFNRINSLIKSAQTKSENTRNDYVLRFSLLKGFIGDVSSNRCSFDVIKTTAINILVVLFQNQESCHLKEITELATQIFRSVKYRLEGNNLDIVRRAMYEIFSIAEFENKDIKWIEKLREKLFNKGSFVPVYKQRTTSMTEDKYNKQLAHKLSELKTILKNSAAGGKLTDNLPSYKKNKQLQAAVEMLVLDIMSILGASENHLENNLLFLDDNTPLLTGKCLRNHLAHGNSLLDVLLSDPSIAVLMNAEKLISENIVKSNKKVGKLVRDDPSKLRGKFDQCLSTITNQLAMFAALEEGDLEKLKICLGNGADIKAKSISSWSALHFASRGPNVEVVKFLVDRNLDPIVKDITGQTPLHVAAAHRRNETVEFLVIKASVPVDILDDEKRTPLQIAAENGHADTVKVLLKYIADIKKVDRAGYSALHYAVESNHVDITEILLENEKHVDREISGGCTALHLAAESGSLEVVKMLLDRHANANANNDKEATPLHPASIKGYLEIVKALLIHGAHVDSKTLDGCTSFFYAVQFGHREIAEVLLQHGAKIDTADITDRYTPLHHAAKKGHDEIVELLLKHKANANATGKDGATPLHLAIENGRTKVVASLLNHGVNIYIRSGSQLPVLHLAAKHGRKEIAQLLIQHGIDAHSKCYDDITPLHIAGLYGHEDVVDFLIKNRAKVNARESHGSTPLYGAAQRGHLNVVRLLARNKADVDPEAANGQTPLYVAALNGHKDVVVFLVENKARVNRKCSRGLTPLHAAVTGCHKDIAEFLIKRGADVNSKGLTPLGGILVPITPLETAVFFKNVEIVELLASNKANVNVKTRDTTPLLTAIRDNNAEMVRTLVAHGADVNVDDGEPLSKAVIGSNVDIVNILLENNARIDFLDPDGLTLLYLAAERTHKEIVSALISKGAEVNRTIQGQTPLFAAAREGRDDIAEVLIANQADVNFPHGGDNPLHVAAHKGHVGMVHILLNNGAVNDAKDKKKRTALEFAIENGHMDVIEILLQGKSMDLNFKGSNDSSVLHLASMGGNLDMVKDLVNRGADIHARDENGAKPIHVAARSGCKKVVEFFLSKGMNIDDASSKTPLTYAVLNNRVEVVKYLAANGADVNAENSNNFSLMHWASMFGFKEVVEALLESGAVYNSVNKFSARPVDLSNNDDMMDIGREHGLGAESAQHADVMKILLATEQIFEAVKRNNASEVEKCIRAGAGVNAKNTKTETTPLHYAAWKGCIGVVNALLENKANPNVTCSKRFTPLHYAAKFAHIDCVKSLLHHGAIYNPVPNSGKTPLQSTTDTKVINLLKLIDDSFRKVRNDDLEVVDDLNKIKDADTLKAIMNACDMKKQTLIVIASRGNLKVAKKLKEVAQGDVSARINQASNLLIRGDYQRASNIHKRSLVKSEQLFGSNNLATLDLRKKMASGLYKQGKYQEALDIFEEVYQKQKEILGEDHKDTLNTRSTIALVLYRQEKFDEAAVIFQQTYEKQKEILGPNDPDTIDTQFHFAMVMQSQNKYEEASNIYRTNYEIRKLVLGPLDITTIAAKNNIASILLDKGEYEEALKIFTEVLEEKKSVFGMAHTDTLRTLHNIGAVFLKQNDYEEAAKIFQQVLDTQKKNLQKNHPDISTSQCTLADVLLHLGKFTPALKLYKECYERKVALHGPNHPSVLATTKKIELINLKFKLEGRHESDTVEYFQNDLNVAANDGDVETVKRLIENGADVNNRDIEGRTPLHFAISSGRIDIVQILLRNGADVTHATNKGNTPLHTAASKNDDVIVRILLKHVSRDKLNDFVNAKTVSAGTTALHVASKNGDLKVAKSLLKYGAVYDIANNDGETPADLAKDREIVKLLTLIDHVFGGVKKGSVEVIDRLKSIKSDELEAVTNARNDENHALLQVAIVHKRQNIVSLLMKMLKKNDQK